MIDLTRAEAIGFRVRAQQLDRSPAARALTDAAIFDLGVQDTGRDAASWALVNRGVPVDQPDILHRSPEVALAWTLRSSPHFYRRADLQDVYVATSPLSETDAAKRVLGADQPLREAGLGVREGLTEVATQLRAVVDRPRVKGEVSSLLTPRLSGPYLRDCRPCRAVHCWEVPFRVAALYGGLELEPGTSPPVLRRIPDWPCPPGPAPDPSAVRAQLQPIRAYLHFLGPATPADVASFLDSPVTEIKRHWPADAVEVRMEGKRAWLLADDLPAAGPPDLPTEAGLVRLLGPFDLLLQGKDRRLLVPDQNRHRELWPTLGRPGAVLAGVDLIGSWRPKASGARFTLRLRLWGRPSADVRAAIGEQAERLAQHRGLRLSGLEEE